jgi:hypothetical protein
MRASVDRELVEQLLQDESLSYREIARRANCSDFSVRTIARELAERESYYADDGNQAEPLTPRDGAILIGLIVLFIGGLCFAVWRMPPPNGGPMT